MPEYDSTLDTLAHIYRVQELLAEVSSKLVQRAIAHDQSKLREPEKSVFDRETPCLRSLTYGSDEYKAALGRLGEALQHHYANNSHHPEFHPDGVNDMTLLDLIEMLVDWKAASERHATGDIKRSIEINADRFHMSPQLVEIFENTARREFGWFI